LFLEQDSVLPWIAARRSDQNYTMGIAFQGSGAWVGRTCLGKLEKLVTRITGVSKVHQRLANSQGMEWVEDHSLTFGNTAFTPRHIEYVDPIFDDRPYSSLLFLTMSRATVDPYGRGLFGGRMIKTDLTIGVLGLHISREVQKHIHAKRRESKGPGAVTPYEPKGWAHQISNGGEPTFKYTTSYWENLSDGRRHDFTLQGEASLGHYTNAAVGVALRAGWLRSEFWTFTSNPLTAANQAKPATRTQKVSPRRLELYAFGAVRGRAVLYNALLQGQFRHSDVKLNDAQVEHLIRETELGASVGWRGVSVVASLNQRSAEYNVGAPRPHTWGGAYLIWRKPPREPS
jgi:hypothetical protein